MTFHHFISYTYTTWLCYVSKRLQYHVALWHLAWRAQLIVSHRGVLVCLSVAQMARHEDAWAGRRQSLLQGLKLTSYQVQNVQTLESPSEIRDTYLFLSEVPKKKPFKRNKPTQQFSWIFSLIVERNKTEVVSQWWFQIFVIFIPTWGNDPIWLIFFKWVETTN